MNETLQPIPYDQVRGSPRSVPLVFAAVLCFFGTLVPLAWLGIQAVNFQHRQLIAAFTSPRLPFGLILLEEAACALTLVALLILSGVLLCVRARWSIHIAGAVMGIAIVGATGATLAVAIERFFEDPTFAKPLSENIAEVALLAGAGIVLPLLVVLMLSRGSGRATIVSRRGSMPGTPVLPFVTGAVLVWYGLAATSVHEQAVPVGIYFCRLYTGTAVTLWRVGFASAWILAGILLLRASLSGWMLAILVTAAAITSEALLAAIGGADALVRKSFLKTFDPLDASLALAGGPRAPELAALWRSATHLCLLGLLLLAALHFLFEDVPDRSSPSEETGQPVKLPPQSGR
jgi:hypothetical protein